MNSRFFNKKRGQTVNPGKWVTVCRRFVKYTYTWQRKPQGDLLCWAPCENDCSKKNMNHSKFRFTFFLERPISKTL